MFVLRFGLRGESEMEKKVELLMKLLDQMTDEEIEQVLGLYLEAVEKPNE